MTKPRRYPSAVATERGASDFASKTAARLAKLSPEERAARLAAFKAVVERAESRAIASGRAELRGNPATTRAR